MAEKCVTATRTVRLRVSPKINPGKLGMLFATVAAWDRAVACYTEFLLDHASTVEEMDRRGLLTWAETHTVATADHPHPARDFGAVCPGMPVVLRRAAINGAAGAVRSYSTNLRAWEKAERERRGKQPQPPRPHPHLVAYAGTVALRMEDFRRGFVRLHLCDGSRWRWANIPVQAPPYAVDLFAQSEAEKRRIADVRAEQRHRMQAEGRKKRTKDERRALLPALGVWVASSPTLVRKRDSWWLHVPFEMRVQIPGKAEEQRLHDPNLRVGTVDLNADSAVAACWEGRRLTGLKTVWHARENAKREKALQKIARKQKHSGTPVKGERSNQALWRYIKALDDSVAWQVAAAIVAWAATSGLRVLVFEHLRAYRPERGLSWSRRTNRKRGYWLRGKVLERVRHLALMHGILVVERNPAWTSQVCPRCSRLGERFSPGGRGYPSCFRCGHCGWTGDANVVAALNLKKKWNRDFRYPTKEEIPAAEPRRARKGGAAASPERARRRHDTAFGGANREPGCPGGPRPWRPP